MFQRTNFVVILLIATGSPFLLAAPSGLDFETEIAPIFQQHCVRCHSPQNAEGDVSLATSKDLHENEYVIAGDPSGSYLLELVTASGEQPAEMPQEGRALSAEEVSLLRRWIGEGARWPENVVLGERPKADGTWWSLQPLSPSSADDNIDDFIRAKLAENELEMSPPADRRTLIRRLSFDLHGLPPSPEAVAAFVEDPDPQAYERLVDTMLESSHYGERFAQHWLDIAHYADTHGFERDKRRDHAWRYRDYVIESFNDDKPYNRFLQEQIAGDILWPDNPKAIVATGFLAAGPWDFVGQVETKSDVLRRAARSLDLDDMATQVMTATMAMTINCARCHDHKLDPISQREYYQLRAVFTGVRRADRVISDATQRTYESEKENLTARLDELDFQIGRLEGKALDLADMVGGGNGLGSGAYRQGIDARTAKVQTRDFGALGNVVPNKFAPSQFDFIDGVFIPDGEDGKSAMTVSSTGIEITDLPSTSGTAWDMIRNGPVASQHSTELDGIDFTRQGHSSLGLHANAGITFDLDAIRRKTGYGQMRFTSRVGYFGASGNFRADAWVYVDGKRVAALQQLTRDAGLQDISVDLASDVRFLTLVATDGGNGYGHDQIGFGDPRLKPASIPSIASADGGEERPDAATNRLSSLRHQRRDVSEQLAALGPPPRFYGVVAREDPPDVRVLTRGDPESSEGEPLPPAALSSLAMLDPSLGTCQSDEGQRRAELARWITHPDNPLTPRVIVNRIWQWHFGEGIVSTPSDFGYGGGRPSHPRLLDYLATELQRRGGPLKEIHRLILHSATYRQQSRFADDAPGVSVDADNRLLWRQNPRRIDAESIRDAVLMVSGKLNRQPGGPGFEDFQYTDAYAPIYNYVTADRPELWRRSIYRFIVRTTPDRFLTTLDCPDPANLTPKRLTTTTPLQSLALYNNDFMLRQARYFTQRLKREAGSTIEDRVRRAFVIAFGRGPTPSESDLAVGFVKQHGLFSLCRSLFNANEFVYVD